MAAWRVLALMWPSDAAAQEPHANSIPSLVVVTADVCSGEVIAGGLVLVTDGITRVVVASDDEGHATFWGLPSNEYSIYEQASGYEPLGGSSIPVIRTTISATGPSRVLSVFLRRLIVDGPPDC